MARQPRHSWALGAFAMIIKQVLVEEEDCVVVYTLSSRNLDLIEVNFGTTSAVLN